jgi:pantoate--beta-alanine ligase
MLMLVFHKVDDISGYLHNLRSAGKTIGFVPTMGALHQGHLELVRMAKDGCDIAVVSIFVNPSQFNDPGDLAKYPRMPEKDTALLLGVGCDVLFLPPVEEIYPRGLDFTLRMDFRQLDQVMEGVFRPGHFEGMATVVNRLVNIVDPDRLYMGQKDFQQLSIVRDMLRQLGSRVELVMCPTVREADGLAMSSRNLRLTPEMRAVAPVIYQTLAWVKNAFGTSPGRMLEAAAKDRLSQAGLKPEYFEIVDGISLLSVDSPADSDFVVACTAAFAGEVRLIDNLLLKQP